MTPGPWIRYLTELPDCCGGRSSHLRLPRPAEVEIEAHGLFGRDQLWSFGLDEWWVRVAVNWDEQVDALYDAVRDHVSSDVRDFEHLVEVLAQHGVHVDEHLRAFVGEQVLVVAHIGSELAAASGRDVIWTGDDLLEAADAAAGDLEGLVAPLIAAEEDDSELWCQEITDNFEAACTTGVVILLRSVNITPVMRGHGLGAWTAAQSVALFDSGDSLVATMAAPLDKQDAIPRHQDDSDPLTTGESSLWGAEQDRLAGQWRTQLGLVPLTNDPTILVWHTSAKNDSIEQTLNSWAP